MCFETSLDIRRYAGGIISFKLGVLFDYFITRANKLAAQLRISLIIRRMVPI